MPGESAGALRAVAGCLLLMALLALGLVWAFSSLDYAWNWGGVWEYRERLWRGWLATLGISAASLCGSLAIGVVVALGRRARFLLVRQAAALYVELVRGTPLLVQILVLYYAVFEVVRLRDAFTSGVLILSVFSGAYMAEILRAGIESIGKSQWDSARAVGFTRWQTYRYVVFPQAVRHVLPPMAGQLASLVKDSSLLSVIAIGEFTLAARDIDSLTLSPFESYLPLALGYLAITLPVSMAARHLEEKFRYET
jgi:polar amino acid transport system permease protein